MKRLAALALMLVVVAANAAGDPAATQHFERGGVAIDFSLTPLDGSLRAGGDAQATLRVSDARTGLPLSGMRPHAWISRRASEMLAAESLCIDKARALASGTLASRADIDLNSFRVLTLNHDKTISVINPLISFGATKLENLIVLPASGADWVLSQDTKTLAVSMPELDSIALIDTASRKVVARLATGLGSQPQRLALAPDGRVWVGLEGSGEVAWFDPVLAASQPVLRARLQVGRGLLSFAFSTDKRHAFVSNSASDRVSVIDAARAERVAEVRVGKTPVAMAYGAASRRLYVALLNEPAIAVIEADQPADVKRIAVAGGVNAIGFEPSGRFAIALSQFDSSVTVIDSADHTVVGRSGVVNEPDQLFFTQRYAYVHGMGSEKFSLLDLAELRAGTVAPLDIQAGRQAPTIEPEHIGRGPMMAPTPDGNAVMIANAPDRTLYFYQEGMMAPMGTFSNYGRAPRSVMVLDHSLRESGPGIYSATVHLTHAGRFDVPVVIDQPRLINCFAAEVATDPKGPSERTRVSVAVQRVDVGRLLTAQRPSELRFRITDTASGAAVPGLADARALVFQPPGVWQQRVPLEDLGDGHYALKEYFPHKGLFNIMIAVPSRGLQFADLAPHAVRVLGIAAVAPEVATVKESP